MEIVHYHFNVIDSTNTWAKQNIHLFDSEGVALVTANTQTMGRGRLGRKWISSPEGNIYATFCFCIDPKRKDYGNIPQVLALSCMTTLKQFGFIPSLKWPNDLLLDERKVGGILCETTLKGKLWFIAGVGINVNMNAAYFLELDRQATSLSMVKKQKVDCYEVLEILKHNFLKDFDRFQSKGFDPFLEPYRKAIGGYKDCLLRFCDTHGVWEGTFNQINESGALELKLATGEIKTFLTGEYVYSTKA